MRTKKQRKRSQKMRLFGSGGGGCGIRTHVTLPSNSFQDCLVMTASITLRISKLQKTVDIG